MPTLLLVDGSSYLYRAFHALPDLRNSAGEPTGAVRGVLSMLRRLESDYKAEYRACVFDAKGKTFRDDWFPDYKAQRPSMPDDLRAQIEPLHEAVRAEGWPLLVEDGVEADDVIGTLTRQAVEAGWEVVISTGDKDLTQLVQPGVRWVNTMSEEVLDEAGVTAKFGVPPNLIVDYLTLIGDTVDNVPGVEKCGPKTAVKWLTEYGNLDNLVANADKVGGKVGENLRKHLDFLPLGRKLVTVVTDLPLPVKGSRADIKTTLVDDLSQSVLANLPVTLTYAVTDAAGQTGTAEPLHLVLPGKRFFDPLADALIEMRRDLLWSRSNATTATEILKAVSNRPEGFITNQDAFKRLRAVIKRLDTEAKTLTPKARDEIATTNWPSSVAAMIAPHFTH